MKKEPIPNYGDHITIKKFISWAEGGYIINDDGFGYYATKTEMTDIIIKPSHITGRRNEFQVKTGNFKVVKVEKKLDKRFSHVVWFNR